MEVFGILLLSVVLTEIGHAHNLRFCTSNSSCRPNECCIRIGQGKRAYSRCKTLGSEGKTCNNKEINGLHYRFCPCDENLECRIPQDHYTTGKCVRTVPVIVTQQTNKTDNNTMNILSRIAVTEATSLTSNEIASTTRQIPRRPLLYASLRLSPESSPPDANSSISGLLLAPRSSPTSKSNCNRSSSDVTRILTYEEIEFFTDTISPTEIIDDKKNVAAMMNDNSAKGNAVKTSESATTADVAEETDYDYFKSQFPSFGRQQQPV